MRKAIWLLAVVCFFGCSSGKKTEQAGTTAAPEAANPNVASTSAAGVTEKTKPQITEATQLIMKREFGKAFDQLNAAIKADEKCAAAYFMRAGIFADAGQNPRAVADFNKAIQLDPENADFFNARGFFLMTRQQYQAAIKDFTAAIKRNSLHAQAVNNRGLSYVGIGQYKEAIADFTEGLKLGPKNHDAFNNRGYAYFQAGDLEKALVDFDSALRLSPDDLNAINNKGLVYFKGEQYEKAAAQFSQAIKRNKLNAKFYRHRREAYLKAGMEAEARADLAKITWLTELARLNQVAARSAKEPSGWIERGHHLAKGDEFVAAAESYNQALKVDAKCAAAHVGLAKLSVKQGKVDEALAQCEKAAELGADIEVASIRGDIYVKQNKLDEAIAAYEAAQRFDSHVADAYLQRAKQRQAKGLVEQAEEDYRQAVTLNPSIEGTRQ